MGVYSLVVNSSSTKNVVLLPFRPCCCSNRCSIQPYCQRRNSNFNRCCPMASLPPKVRKSFLPDLSCLLATANKPSELMLLWEPSTTPIQSSQSEVPSPAIHNTQLSQLLTTITQSLLLLPTLT